MVHGQVQRKLTVVMPAFNEADAVGKAVEHLVLTCSHVVEEILVVDDGSSDDTGQIAEKAGSRVIRHEDNLGYGAALKTGVRAATTEYVVTMDADGQHKAEDILRLWIALADADMVVGKRTGLVHSPLWRMPGKWLLSLTANYLVKRRIPDLNSGLRLFRRATALKYLHLCPSGFSFSTTITMALLSRGYRVLYVPIEVEKRSGKSTVSVTTGFETVLLILRIASLFNPLRLFIPGSVLCVSVGVVWGIPFAVAGHGISVGAMLAIVTGVLLFGFGLLCDQVSQLRLERFE